jgi:hypothetical protein
MSNRRGFSIEVVPGSVALEAGDAEASGMITVGDFRETFRMALSFWDANEYRRSWGRALRRLEDREVVDSCLVSSITEPKSANFIFCWPVYRRNEEVFVQNSIIFLDELEGRFDAEEPWLFINPRRTVNDDGDLISEWATTISEVRRFVRDGYLT